MAQTAVMGPQQAAGTMGIVMRESARAKGDVVDEARLEAIEHKVVQTFERQMSAFYTSGLLLDDGLIDPRDTRKVLALTLSLCLKADGHILRPMQYGVARP